MGTLVCVAHRAAKASVHLGSGESGRASEASPPGQVCGEPAANGPAESSAPACCPGHGCTNRSPLRARSVSLGHRVTPRGRGLEEERAGSSVPRGIGVGAELEPRPMGVPWQYSGAPCCHPLPVCAQAYLCTHVCVCGCMHMDLHMHARAYMHAHPHSYMHTRMCTHMYAYMHVQKDVRTRVLMHSQMCAHTCTRTHSLTPTYAHVHTHVPTCAHTKAHVR